MPHSTAWSTARIRRTALAALVALPAVTACGISSAGEDDGPAVQVYSARSYGAEQAYERFTEETGIRVEFLNGNDA